MAFKVLDFGWQANVVAIMQKLNMTSICYFYLADIYSREDETEKVIEYYQLAISIYPEFPVVHQILAGICMAKKELE